MRRRKNCLDWASWRGPLLEPLVPGRCFHVSTLACSRCGCRSWACQSCQVQALGTLPSGLGMLSAVTTLDLQANRCGACAVGLRIWRRIQPQPMPCAAAVPPMRSRLPPHCPPCCSFYGTFPGGWHRSRGDTTWGRAGSAARRGPVGATVMTGVACITAQTCWQPITVLLLSTGTMPSSTIHLTTPFSCASSRERRHLCPVTLAACSGVGKLRPVAEPEEPLPQQQQLHRDPAHGKPPGL